MQTTLTIFYRPFFEMLITNTYNFLFGPSLRKFNGAHILTQRQKWASWLLYANERASETGGTHLTSFNIGVCNSTRIADEHFVVRAIKWQMTNLIAYSIHFCLNFNCTLSALLCLVVLLPAPRLKEYETFLIVNRIQNFGFNSILIFLPVFVVCTRYEWDIWTLKLNNIEKKRKKRLSIDYILWPHLTIDVTFISKPTQSTWLFAQWRDKRLYWKRQR